MQADCFAGVWAKHAEAQYKFLDAGDIDAALQTASAIGDDMLQRRSQGTVVPAAALIRRILERSHFGVKDYEVLIPDELLAQSQRTHDNAHLLHSAS